MKRLLCFFLGHSWQEHMWLHKPSIEPPYEVGEYDLCRRCKRWFPR